MLVPAAAGGLRADTGPVIGEAFGVTLARAQAGDEAAFACIFRDVQPALLRYLRVIAPEAEDVAGDTWLQVVAGLAGFRGGEQAFRSWLFTIARHRAADAGRSRARRPAVPLEASGAAEQLMSPDSADLALEAVSARAVLARIVGKTPGAVRVAAHRGLRRLASRVERAGVTQ